MGSSETSEITVDSSEMVRAGTSSFLDCAVLEARSRVWTNEKHCLYLKSMEESFVNELHCAMGLCRGQEQMKKVLEKDLFQQHKSFRDGVCKSTGVSEYGGRSEALTLMRNQWIRHFRNTGKHQAVEIAIYEDIDQDADQEIESEKKENLVLDNNSRESTTTLSRQDSVDSNIELSDQNFIDNDVSMKSSRVRRAKRSRKMEPNNNIDSEQVVPKDLKPGSYSKRMALNHRC